MVDKPPLGDGHSYARSNALPEWTGRGFNARNPMILGVPRSFAVELAEVTDILEGNRRVTEPFVIGVTARVRVRWRTDQSSIEA